MRKRAGRTVVEVQRTETAGTRVIGRVVLYALLILFALYYLMPLFVMLTTSLKTLDDIRGGNLISLPEQISFDAWIKAWSSACTGVNCGGLSGNFWNSVSFVLPAVAISTLIGALNGYVLTMWRFRGSDALFTLLLIGCFIPFQVVLLPMAQTLGWLGIANSTTGLIFVHVVYGLAFTTLFFRNFYVAIPEEMVKAARIDGAGFFRIFWRIILPLSPPILVVCVIWQFTQIWNDFLFGVVFSSGERQPITVALNNLVNTSTGVKEYNVDMAAAIIAGLPTLFVYVVAGKYFVRGLTAGSVKG
jgi:glucose/mannose transport system permease protein